MPPTAGRTDILNGESCALDDPALPKDWYTTDLWTDYGIKFIDEARAAKKPFFLYLAHNAPHFPLQAPQEEIAKFRGKYKIGWDKLREQRHARQIELGVVDQAWPLSPRPEEVKAWDDLTASEQDRFDHIMAIYAAVHRACGYRRRPLGRRAEAARRARQHADPVHDRQRRQRRERAQRPARRRPARRPNSTVFEGQSWATLSNTPLRRYKHFNHEGGIATPLIVHWPARHHAPRANCANSPAT